MSTKKDGYLIVVTGPPASGKDTVMEGILTSQELTFKKIVTHTTREKREGETHGVDYHFVKEEEFIKMVEKGEIVEYVKHGSSWKGTHREPFRMMLSGTENYVWRIDPSRSANLKEFFTEKFGQREGLQLWKRTLIFYVDVQDHSLLEERWKSREGNDNLEEFRKRYKQDIEAYEKNKNKFHVRLVNDRDPDSVVTEAIDHIKQYFGLEK